MHGEDAAGDGTVAEQRVRGGARDDVSADAHPLRSAVDEVTAARRQRPVAAAAHRRPERDARTRDEHRTAVAARVHQRTARTRLHQRRYHFCTRTDTLR